MSSSLVPGCAAMKYGIRYCFLPASALYWSNSCLEAVVAADARLHHLRQRPALGVLGRDLQVAADVVRDQFLHVLGRLHRQVVAQARADQDLLHAAQRARAAVQLDQRAVVGVQVRADAGVDAARLAAGGLDGRALAADAPHVGRGPAEVADDAGETLDLVADVLDLADDRVFAAALDDAALVLGDRAEGAAAEAAAHDVDAEADHFPGRDLGRAVVAAGLVGVARVRAARVGQVEDLVHLGRGQRDRRRVDPHVALGRAAAPAPAHCRGWSPGAARGWHAHRARCRS